MKNLSLVLFFFMLFTMTGCEVVGDIFSVGFYSGIAVVIAVVVLIIWLFSRRRR